MSAVDSAEALSSGVGMLVFPWAKAGAPNTRDTSVTVSSFMEFFSLAALVRFSARPADYGSQRGGHAMI
jgi:hypothetical protein